MTNLIQSPAETCKTCKTCAPTVEEFIGAVFRDLPDGARVLVCSVPDDPQSASASYQAHLWPDAAKLIRADTNNFVVFSSFNPDANGQFHRRKAQCAAVHALMLDDLGTKASMERLGGFQLSWLLETSPGNYQGGILFDEPVAPATADLLNRALIEAGICDEGARDPATRLGRLPLGINGKPKYHGPSGEPFTVRMVEWHPDARYSPEDIAQALELDLSVAHGKRARAATASAPISNADGMTRHAHVKALRDGEAIVHPFDDVFIPAPTDNPVIAALQARNLYRRALGGGKHEIICPWAHEHTGGDIGGTAYFEPSELYPLGGFKCLHSHGERLKIRDLLIALEVTPAAARMKPTIRVAAGELDRVIDAAEARLAELGQYWQHGGLIVTIGQDAGGDARIIQVSIPALTRALARGAIWERFDGRAGEWKRCDPPERHVRCLHDAQHYRHLPELRGIARQPYLHEGRIVMTKGFDTRTGIFGAFEPGAFPVKPDATMEDARAALEELTGLLSEFRFAEEIDRAAALAALLTAAVRPSLPHAPMFHVKAPVQGSGKSFLCKLITAFATPGLAAPSSYPSDSAEATKALLALLLQNPAVIEFDDMATDLMPFSAINRALTEEAISERILGESATARVSTRVLFLSSGNNVGPVRDMLRRVVTIQLDPRCQTPTQISYQGDPQAKVRANRARFVALALNIVLAWRNAGEPRAAVPPIATYGGAWADCARHPLLWLGLPDPATRLLEQVTSDTESDALGRVLALWHERFGGQPMMVREVLRRLLATDELYDALLDVAEERGDVSRNRLGWWLKRHESRIVGGLMFRRSENSRGVVAWRVVKAESAGFAAFAGFGRRLDQICQSTHSETQFAEEVF